MLKEGYAWEYLWENWYKWDKWQLWARAVSMDYYPIIQTNAPVETHWNTLKNRVLLWLNRIRIDHLCAEIHFTFLPSIVNKIAQIRKRVKACSSHKAFVKEWKGIEEKIGHEDEEDLVEAFHMSIDPESDKSPCALRRARMETMHRTDLINWHCQCSGFNYSPSHLCSHLLRLYGQPCPLKGEVVRQHVRPLLWIDGLHTETQRFIRIPDSNQPSIQVPASLQRLGIPLNDDMLSLQQEIEAMDDDLEDPSRFERDVKGYETFLEQVERAVKYARNEIQQSHKNREKFRRLPKPTVQGFNSLFKLAKNAHILDHSRRRRGTWSIERAGANLRRD
jgi:hypothetical protein